MSFISPERKPDMVQSVLEESIARRKHDPSEPSVLEQQSPPIFIKLLLWFKAKSARTMDVRIVVEKSDTDSGYQWTRERGGVLEAHVTRRKSLSPQEEAELKNWVRNGYKRHYDANPLTRRDKFILWLLLLGSVGGIIAMVVWNHLLASAGAVR